MESQRQISWDRISALPEDITAKILTLMPIKDALRTSILSNKWRYCWTRMPKLVFDNKLFDELSGYEDLVSNKLGKAIFQVLLLHRAPILELSLFVNEEIISEIDQIILYLSRSNTIKKFIFDIWVNGGYVLPWSFLKLQGLEHLELSNCKFEPPFMNKGFSMLKTLSFENMYVPAKMLQGFLTNCPLLEEFSWIREDPINLTECAFVELFKCLPSVQVLQISGFYIENFDAGGMPRELPNSLVNLRILDLECRKYTLTCLFEVLPVLCVISSSPNLEKIKLAIYGAREEQTSNNLLGIQGYTGLNLLHLEELEMRWFSNHALEMEFVKLIMSKSPVLKKARIELYKYVSVLEEVKILRHLLLLPRASPTANFIIERPKDLQGKEIYPS